MVDLIPGGYEVVVQWRAFPGIQAWQDKDDPNKLHFTLPPSSDPLIVWAELASTNERHAFAALHKMTDAERAKIMHYWCSCGRYRANTGGRCERCE